MTGFGSKRRTRHGRAARSSSARARAAIRQASHRHPASADTAAAGSTGKRAHQQPPGSSMLQVKVTLQPLQKVAASAPTDRAAVDESGLARSVIVATPEINSLSWRGCR